MRAGLSACAPASEKETRVARAAWPAQLVFQPMGAFFTHTYWDLETTMTTFKNNIILRTHLEH